MGAGGGSEPGGGAAERSLAPPPPVDSRGSGASAVQPSPVGWVRGHGSSCLHLLWLLGWGLAGCLPWKQTGLGATRATCCLCVPRGPVCRGQKPLCLWGRVSDVNLVSRCRLGQHLSCLAPARATVLWAQSSLRPSPHPRATEPHGMWPSRG